MVDQNQQLLVWFLNLGAHDVIIPGTVRLAFTVSLNSTDANRTVVQNLGRAIVKKMTIKISRNEVLSIDDSDVFHCYQDLWKTAQERSNSQYQGIDLSDDRNVDRIPVGSGNKDETETEDAAIALAFGNLFHIPLDFELLETHVPFYQSALGDRLEYELTFNDYSCVIVATGNAATSNTVENIALEFDMVTQPDLARQIRNQYGGRLTILYDRVLRHLKITANKSDTLWNINLNVPARSMKGILLLFEDPAAAFQRDTEAFYNPQIQKVEVTIEGIPHQLYSQGMRAYQHWQEARKHFAGGTKQHSEVAVVAKDLALADVSLGEFLTTKQCLWLDLRTTDDDQLHGNGRRVENAPEGVTIQITKKAETAGALNIYLYVLMDAQLNIEDGRFVSALYWAMLAADQPPFGNHLWANGLREDRFCPEPSRGPLPWGLPPRRDPMPHHQAQQDLPESPVDWGDPEVYVIDPGERLHDCLRIRSSRVSPPYTSLTTAVQARLWPKRRTCCPSWLLVAATQAPLSWCSPRNTLQSSRTSGSRPAG